ncbi:unnamed protein product, partial [Chrysoparadoxa australica]
RIVPRHCLVKHGQPPHAVHRGTAVLHCYVAAACARGVINRGGGSGRAGAPPHLGTSGRLITSTVEHHPHQDVAVGVGADQERHVRDEQQLEHVPLQRPSTSLKVQRLLVPQPDLLLGGSGKHPQLLRHGAADHAGRVRVLQRPQHLQLLVPAAPAAKPVHHQPLV